MTKSRLEAFSDGVLAIIITIMVLEIKVPHEVSIHALKELYPVFLSYLMSFVFIAIYWGNHHHLLHTIKTVNSKIIWANNGLLFVLSLIPFSTGYMGENHFAELTVAVYAINILFSAFAAYLLQRAVFEVAPEHSAMVAAMKKVKSKIFFSLGLNLLSIGLAFYVPMIAFAIVGAVMVLWLIPDKHVERALNTGS